MRNARIPAAGLLAAISLSMLGSTAPAQDPPQQELTAKSFAQWRDAIAPTPQELAFQKIGWHAEFRSALREAQRLDKPVLLWAMNGHPLGCV